jgi:membrane associated rhomboid family serine protease
MSSIIDDLRNEFSKTNNSIVKLILVNVAVFLIFLVLNIIFSLSQYTGYYNAVMAQVALPAHFATFIVKPWTLLTNFFVHQSIWHLLFNMLFLYWFGRLVEEYLGSKRLISLYILGGLAGGILFLLMYNVLPYFAISLSRSTLIGASGAIFAVILGAATLLPDYTFFILLLGPIRIKYIAAFYVVLSMVELLGNNAGGNIAHLAGALVGFGFIKALRRGYDWGAPIMSILDFFDNLTSKRQLPTRLPERAKTATATTIRKYNVAQQSTATSEFPDQDDVDSILDKISKSGYASLTREEQQILYKASQQD